jgi:hypothetical protein
MNRDDFVKLVGVASEKAEYLPVAFLLRNGYACAGYYHSAVNADLVGTCVLLNARLIGLLGDNRANGQPSINDFNDFLEEVVVDFCESDGKSSPTPRAGITGKSIPLTAIPYDEISVVYPVAHIGALMRRAGMQEQQDGSQQGAANPNQSSSRKNRLPTFFDLDKSEIINLLRIKLW